MIYYCCFAYGFVLAKFFEFIADNIDLDSKTFLIAILGLLMAPIFMPVAIFVHWLFSNGEDL
jgi:hypothetical protein